MAIYEQIFKKHGLSPTQQEIIKLVGKNKTVLEVGSSTGYMTQIFLKNGCIVDAVEIDKKAIQRLPKKVRKVLNYSIEDSEVENKLSRDYDYIIMADVLEHLVEPAKVLKILNKVASNKTKLIISLPNVASWVMRKQLFFKGDFEYQESGILDKTHLHFYTINTLPKLLSEFGWKVENMIGTIIRLPFEDSINKIPILAYIFKKILYKYIAKKFPNLSYLHFYVEALKK